MKKSYICLSVVEPTLEENIRNIRKYKDNIDIVELRADYLNKEELPFLHKFPEMTEFPVILTIRKETDGGKFTGNENERVSLLEKGTGGEYAYVDIEQGLINNRITGRIKETGKKIIRSFHDFDKVPADLTKRIKDIADTPGEIPKAAVMPKNMKEVMRLLQSYKECKEFMFILLGMGNFGFPTRILAPYLGSYLTYCSVPDKLAAPGHIDPVTLTDLYQYRNISRKTSIYGIIGNPVMHTLSPKIHNKGFADSGIDAVYLPFQVDSVKDFLGIAELLSIKGFSVTIPHKSEIIQYLSQTDENVKKMDACNTVFRGPSGWNGFNADGPGFIEALKEKFHNKSLQGLRATVVGAGGAAKAIVYSLLLEGIGVLIINRTAQKAENLAKFFSCEWAGLDEHGMQHIRNYSDLIVQTTSAGMEPYHHLDPIPGYTFKGHEIVYEIVFKPEETILVKRAKKAGCRIIPGIEMLLKQAFIQFKLFTNREYPDKEGIKKLV